MSRDVIFNEQKFGYDSIDQEPESQRFVYLDCLDDALEHDCPTIEESPANAVDTDASQVMPDSSLHAPRRSQREKRKPDRYGFPCNLTAVEEPVAVNDVLTRQE